MAKHIAGILLIGGALTLAPTAAWAQSVARLAPVASEQAAIPFARGTDPNGVPGFGPPADPDPPR